MPFTRAADGTRIRYAVHGPADAPLVLMIQGLGTDSRGWGMQHWAFSRRYRVITFDNRGVGRSDKPVGPYALETMAADAFTVLDAAGVDAVHVVGASLGGVIAQIMAIEAPHRVRSLVLAATACRNPRWRQELLLGWRATAQAQGMRSFARANLRWLLGSRSVRRFGPAIGFLAPLAMSAPVHGFVAQIDAILSSDQEHFRALAHRVTMPALVIVGSQDILTPLADSEEILELAPHAELAVVRGAAHGFMVENAPAFNRTVLDFLDRASEATLVGDTDDGDDLDTTLVA